MAEHPTAAEQMQARVERLRVKGEAWNRRREEAEAEKPGQMALAPTDDEGEGE